jgi:hypothetical protein
MGGRKKKRIDDSGKKAKKKNWMTIEEEEDAAKERKTRVDFNRRQLGLNGVNDVVAANQRSTTRQRQRKAMA